MSRFSCDGSTFARSRRRCRSRRWRSRRHEPRTTRRAAGRHGKRSLWGRRPAPASQAPPLPNEANAQYSCNMSCNRPIEPTTRVWWELLSNMGVFIIEYVSVSVFLPYSARIPRIHVPCRIRSDMPRIRIRIRCIRNFAPRMYRIHT